MKNYNLKNIGKKILIGGTALFALLLVGGEAKAVEYLPRPTKHTLEQRISKGEALKREIKIISNYYTESKQEAINYLTSQTRFSRIDGVLQCDSNIPELSPVEETQVENIIKDIKNKDINSYQEFVGQASNLSERQKLILLSAIGELSRRLGEESKNEVVLQDDFFSKLQVYLESGEKNGLGECNHIHSHLEQLANDIGIKAAAVTGSIVEGERHMYNITKLKDKSAIIDYGGIFITDTKNIEKTLEAYQKDKGITVFRHYFYEGTEFKYRLITKDGRHFLDFVGYDESSKPMKDLLLYGVELDTKGKIILDYADYLSSVELNGLGLFAKAGEIRGSSSSPMEKIKLLQGGYKGNFSISDLVSIGGNISLIHGELYQDKKPRSVFTDYFDFGIPIEGRNYDGFVRLNNKEGTFNFTFRASKSRFSTGKRVLFYDSTIGAGISYKIPTKAGDVEPYVTMQYSDFPSDIGTEKNELKFSELGIGTLFDIKPSGNINLSIEPYLIKRIWEKEFGANARFGKKNFGLNLGMYKTDSDYEFCPDKNGFNIGLYKDFNKWDIWSKYEMENLDYDGEVEKQRTFNIGASLMF